MYEDHEQTAALAPRDDAGRRTTNPLPRTCRARRERRFSAQCPCGGRWSWAGPVRSSAPPTAGTATPEEIRVLWCTRNAAQVGWLVSRGPGTGFSGVQLPSADIGAKVPPPHGFGSEKLLPHAFIPLGVGVHRDLARETNSSREKTVTRPRFTREATLSTFELDSPSPAAALT